MKLEFCWSWLTYLGQPYCLPPCYLHFMFLFLISYEEGVHQVCVKVLLHWFRLVFWVPLQSQADQYDFIMVCNLHRLNLTWLGCWFGCLESCYFLFEVLILSFECSDSFNEWFKGSFYFFVNGWFHPIIIKIVKIF